MERNGEHNKDVVRQAFAAMTAGPDAWREAHPRLFDDRLVGHFPGMPPVDALAHLEMGISTFDAFPDLERPVEDLFAEGSKVVARWTSYGTNTGSFMGIPATGKRATMSGLTIFRLEDGKIIEEWSESNMLGLLMELGAIPGGQATDDATGPDRPAVVRFRGLLEAHIGAGTRVPDDMLADGVTWTGSRRGVVDGHDLVAQAWQGSAPGSTANIVGVFVDSKHAIGAIELAEDGNRVLQVHVSHLDSSGKVAKLWTIPADDAAEDALRGTPRPMHANLSRFREAEEARARNEFTPNDLSSISAFLREDAEWHTPYGPAPKSREEVLQLFQQFNQASGDSLKFLLGEVVADDQHAVSLVTIVADRPDRPDKHLEVGEANVFHLDAEGRCFEFWGVSADQAAMDAFWSD